MVPARVIECFLPKCVLNAASLLVNGSRNSFFLPIQLPNHPRRVPHCQRVVRNIMGDDGAGADDTAVADGDAGADGGVAAYPATFADADG